MKKPSQSRKCNFTCSLHLGVFFYEDLIPECAFKYPVLASSTRLIYEDNLSSRMCNNGLFNLLFSVLIFSNYALHWLGLHEKYFPKYILSTLSISQIPHSLFHMPGEIMDYIKNINSNSYIP